MTKIEKYPYKILFIEDENNIRNNYVQYLNLYFDEVFQASDGLEAYEIYKEKEPHIMIIDINLPKLSGIDLLKSIREKDSKTEVIILSAHSEKEIIQELESLSISTYLVKPVNRKDLKSALSLVTSQLN